MSRFAMTNKPRALACFAILCALHAAVFSAAGIFSTAQPAPARRDASPLVFEFESAAQIATPPVPRATPPAPVERAAPTETVEPAFEAPETPPASADVSAAEGAAESAYMPAQPSRAMSESDYLAVIMRRLEENKVYPLAMRKRGIEGDMPVRFTIGADGALVVVTAEDSRAHPFLAQAALETVKSASPFPVMEGRSGDFSARVIIRYELK